MINKFLRIFTLLITLSVLISAPLVAASTASVENLAVIVGSPTDNEISIAIETLVIELGTVTVVVFGSLEYFLITSFRPILNLVIVGHGNEDGIGTDSGFLKWSDMFDRVKNLNVLNEIYFLSCDSYKLKLLENTSDKLGLTFSGQIDAKVGAMIVSALIKIRFGQLGIGFETLERAYNLDIAISDGKLIGNFLGLGTGEKIRHASMILFFAFLIIVDLYLPSATWNAFAAYIYMEAAIIAIAVHYNILAYEVLETANHFLDILKLANNNDVLGFLWDNLSFWDYIAFAATLTALVALAVFTAGGSEVAKILAFMATLGFWAVKFKTDYDDCDDIFYGSDTCPPPAPASPTGTTLLDTLESGIWTFSANIPGASTVRLSIDWGDGTSQNVEISNGASINLSHNYYSAGAKYIKFKILNLNEANAKWSWYSNSKYVYVSDPSPPGGPCGGCL